MLFLQLLATAGIFAVLAIIVWLFHKWENNHIETGHQPNWYYFRAKKVENLINELRKDYILPDKIYYEKFQLNRRDYRELLTSPAETQVRLLIEATNEHYEFRAKYGAGNVRTGTKESIEKCKKELEEYNKEKQDKGIRYSLSE